MTDELSAEENKTLVEKICKISTLIIAVFLCCLAVYVLYQACSFLVNFEGSSLTKRGVIKIVKLFFTMFLHIAKVTFPYIFPPVILYIFLEICMNKLPYIMRLGSELGCIYIFYILSRMVSPTQTHWVMKWMANGLQWVILLFQVYFLLIMIMPKFLKGIITCVVSFTLSIAIYILPDLPGSLDDIAAICTVTVVLFCINTLAALVKRLLVPFIVKIIHNIWIFFTTTERAF